MSLPCTASGAHELETAQVGAPTAAPVQALPQEALLRIFSYLDPADCSAAATVCQEWHDISRDHVSHILRVQKSDLLGAPHPLLHKPSRALNAALVRILEEDGVAYWPDCAGSDLPQGATYLQGEDVQDHFKAAFGVSPTILSDADLLSLEAVLPLRKLIFQAGHEGAKQVALEILEGHIVPEAAPLLRFTASLFEDKETRYFAREDAGFFFAEGRASRTFCPDP
ncbi:MAG: hypothetical protein C0514_00525 [Candidatus Puniceispirillum sp.]|nr:hypothetical protein [Candidatus Puniceispirillum sp.]